MAGDAAKIGVIGTTTWGTTLAMLMSRSGHNVSIWARTEEDADRLDRTRSHQHLPGVVIPPEIAFSASPEAVLDGADLALVVVPSRSLQGNLDLVVSQLALVPLVVSATKGLEEGTARRPCEIITSRTGDSARCAAGVLSGPNLAREVASGQPGSATVAFENLDHANQAQQILNTQSFRVYASNDVVGVELGGGLKNIIAIGAGVIDGLKLGDNAKAAFISRGLAEITRLGVAMGARPETFAGLSGMGDLVASCYSPLARNRLVGERLAAGQSVLDILEEMGQVAEGVHTTNAALEMAHRVGVEMPITTATAQVLAGEVDPLTAIAQLMSRAPQVESR
ncbi:MAG: NAD(P)-dependent glycerol-3-phosphate dehydrogenase [Chloroflexi bacterium]|nr:NAD(P)-dependent glycerol-3-phosphate dehydrogenase [Chloroflexota bacterium]